MKRVFASIFIAGIAVSLSAQTKAAPAATVKQDTAKKPVAAVADTGAKASAAKPDAAKPLELTVEQLAKFNGQNGQPAYVAADGVIYDVSKAKGWKDGKHKGFSAGQDITKLLKKESPHGAGVLKSDPVVGKLITPAPAAAPVK